MPSGYADWSHCVSERTETETEAEPESPMYYVIGAILYRTLGVILPAPK